MKKTKSKKMKTTRISEQEILVVKVGTDERPASSSDILHIQELLASAANNPSAVIVTHHAIDFSVIKRKYIKCLKIKVKADKINGYHVNTGGDCFEETSNVDNVTNDGDDNASEHKNKDSGNTIVYAINTDTNKN